MSYCKGGSVRCATCQHCEKAYLEVIDVNENSRQIQTCCSVCGKRQTIGWCDTCYKNWCHLVRTSE